MPQPDEAIRAYLLGLLPEADAEAVEDAYFVDPEAFDRVRAVEDDLLDDYAAGRLGPTEKGAFESRYLASEPLRQRVTAARALRMAAGSAALTRKPQTRVATGRRMAPLAIAAAFLVAIGWALFWTLQTVRVIPPGPPPSLARVRPTPESTPSLVPTASPMASGAPGASPIAPATTRLVFALSPTLLRGEGGPVEVRFPTGTGAVTLELQGDRAAAPRGARLQVAIETVEGARAWSGPAQRAGRRSIVASVTVPADRLPPADYLATLSAGDQVLHRYFFRVPGR